MALPSDIDEAKLRESLIEHIRIQVTHLSKWFNGDVDTVEQLLPYTQTFFIYNPISYIVGAVANMAPEKFAGIIAAELTHDLGLFVQLLDAQTNHKRDLPMVKEFIDSYAPDSLYMTRSFDAFFFVKGPVVIEPIISKLAIGRIICEVESVDLAGIVREQLKRLNRSK